MTSSSSIKKPRALLLAGTLGALACLSIAGLSLSAAPALADGCPNEQLRAENNSTRLPECRAYEMVTPVYKEGYPVIAQTFNDEGALAYQSAGGFAGNEFGAVNNEYVARRSSMGWSTTSLDPPPSTYETAIFLTVEGLSLDLGTSLWASRRGEAPEDSGFYYYLRGPDGSMTRVGQTEGQVYTVGTSTDLSHIVFAHGATGSGNAGAAAEWEYVGTGNEGLPRPVSVDNNGQQLPSEVCPAGSDSGLRRLPGMSSDGRVIVFRSRCQGGNEGIPSQVWARVGGTATVAVSGSECTRTAGDPGGPCNAQTPSEFAGMAIDGSRVFFTTTQQLVGGDTDQTSDLYECDIPPGSPAPVGAANPCASLTEVTGNAIGANVQSVISVSEDGSHVYFVAQGALATNLGTNDAALVAGENNLYVWEKDAAHPAGQTTFISRLEAGIERAQSTADGRYLVFQTASRLLASDTDEATDVYRYDAQTGALLRLSTGTSGTAGNEPGFDARLPDNQGLSPTLPVRPTAMSSDASTVIFETTEALSPADTDGIADVYEWHGGRVSLISNGGGSVIGITRSGQDIFFETGPLALQGGTDGGFYDARVDGGFPSTTSEPCSGAACHGALTLQPQLPGASGSAVVSGPGSVVPAQTPSTDQSKPTVQTAAQKLAKALKACRTKHNRKKRKACEKRARNTYRRGK